jgi:hypothetical protein
MVRSLGILSVHAFNLRFLSLEQIQLLNGLPQLAPILRQAMLASVFLNPGLRHLSGIVDGLLCAGAMIQPATDTITVWLLSLIAISVTAADAALGRVYREQGHGGGLRISRPSPTVAYASSYRRREASLSGSKLI